MLMGVDKTLLRENSQHIQWRTCNFKFSSPPSENTMSTGDVFGKVVYVTFR